MPTTHRRPKQGELAFESWGGPPANSGRKRKSERPRVTARLRVGLPSLRDGATQRALEVAFAAGRERFGLRLVHFSVQTNHLHLIVEAQDHRSLARGMQGLLVRTARALNRLWTRKGRVFDDRYHVRALATPREVRHALVYVLLNARHHGIALAGVDPHSSSRWFDGWREDPCPIKSERLDPRCVVDASTWLLRVGWRRWGRIGMREHVRDAA